MPLKKSDHTWRQDTFIIVNIEEESPIGYPKTHLCFCVRREEFVRLPIILFIKQPP